MQTKEKTFEEGNPKDCLKCIHFHTRGRCISCEIRPVHWGTDMKPRWWCFEQNPAGPASEPQPDNGFRMKDPQKMAIIKKLYGTIPAKEVAERTNMTVKSVYMAAKRLGLAKPHKKTA